MKQALFVWASGRIQCADKTPSGAIEIARGERRHLVAAIKHLAQINPVHAYWEVREVAALQENPPRQIVALIVWQRRFLEEMKRLKAAAPQSMRRIREAPHAP